jgi:transposase
MEDALVAGGERSSKRRYWTIDEKRRIVEETLSCSTSVAALARQHGLNANQLFYWCKLYHSGQLGYSSSVEGSNGVRLLPVAVADELLHEAHRDAIPAKRTINIEFPGRALVSVEGDFDVDMIRVVLESLRG